MHQTTYGYNIMDQGDPAKGATGWFAGINSNWNRMSGHSHNGTDSVQLAINAFLPLTVAILAASWITSDKGDGGSMQTFSTPAGIDDCANYNVIFEFTAPAGMVGQRAALDWVRVSATSIKVYTNDVTSAFTVLFR